METPMGKAELILNLEPLSFIRQTKSALNENQHQKNRNNFKKN